MTSHFRASIDHFGLFTRPRSSLSDTVIAPVLPSKRLRDNTFGETVYKETLRSSPHLAAKQAKASIVSSPARLKTRQRLAQEAKAERRRGQIRASQARYREKQRKLELQGNQRLQELQEEIEGLKLKRQRLRFHSNGKPSTWNIVGEVLHLIETSFHSPWTVAGDEIKKHPETQRSVTFLRDALSPKIAMGDLQGSHALLEQVRRYSLYFGEPQLEVKRIESVVAGVTKVTATLSVTITEFTIKSVFPHLNKTHARENLASAELLKQQLLGQRLHCSCLMALLFETDSGLVERVETSIDFVGAFAGLLGSLVLVTNLLEGSLLTSEGCIGDTSRRASDDKK